VRIVLLILGIWLLINVLFVVVVRPRSGGNIRPRPVDPGPPNNPFDGDNGSR